MECNSCKNIDKIEILVCGHELCDNCIMQKSQRCPICLKYIDRKFIND